MFCSSERLAYAPRPAEGEIGAFDYLFSFYGLLLPFANRKVQRGGLAALNVLQLIGLFREEALPGWEAKGSGSAAAGPLIGSTRLRSSIVPKNNLPRQALVATPPELAKVRRRCQALIY